MEGDFYRVVPRRSRLKKVLQKVFKNRRRTVLVAGAAVLLVYLLFDNKGIIKRVQLELQRKEMAAKVEEARKETKQLQEQLKALEGDKKTIEKVAREKYGMAREGETIYKVKKN